MRSGVVGRPRRRQSVPDEQHRQRLAAMQAHLAASLTSPSQSALPPGFDAKRLELAAAMLRQKRGNTLAHLLPCLIRFLGDDFEKLFVAYFDEAPGPPPGGTLADAMAFARFVAARRPLSADAAREILTMKLGAKRFAWLRLESPPRLLIGLRVFGRRIRFLRLPLWWMGWVTSADSKTPGCAGPTPCGPGGRSSGGGAR